MKKQLFGLVLALILCFALLPVSAFAAVEDTFTVDSITYKILTEDTAAGTGTVQVGDGDNSVYTDDSPTDITIPETVTPDNGITYTVTAIGDWAFFECASLTSVTIPDSVTEIGIFAFSSTGLTSVTIPNKVTKISDHAFALTPLTSVTIPASVTEIDQYAFFQCFDLSSVEILGPITKISDFTFTSTALTSITIPSTVTEIGVRAFNACTSLESVIIPEGVTAIGTGAFAYCELLAEVTIPESVTAIGESAFIDCTALETVVFLGNPDLPEDIFAVSDVDASSSLLKKIYFPYQYAEKYDTFIDNYELQNGEGGSVERVYLYKLTVKNGVAKEGALPQFNAVGYYTSGDEFEIVAIDAPEGTVFDGWTVDPETTETMNHFGDPQKTTTTFTMPSEDVTLTANFVYAVTVPEEEVSSDYTNGTLTDLTFKSTDGPYAEFIGVKVDNVLLTPEQFESRMGSTIVTLKGSYLETLDAGEHTITLLFEKGTATTSFEVIAAPPSSDAPSSDAPSSDAPSSDAPSDPSSEIPSTGENSRLWLWFALLLVSGTGILGICMTAKEARQQKD